MYDKSIRGFTQWEALVQGANMMKNATIKSMCSYCRKGYEILGNEHYDTKGARRGVCRSTPIRVLKSDIIIKEFYTKGGE